MNNKKARVIAFYLPQFHPVPENDEWWGKGFTEWTNVGKAKPLFKGHYQPRVPADLGYYDLRMPEVREAQAQMAKEAGIEGFMYWHYWFGEGKTILERPFNEVLQSGKPDFPFCLGWANHSWTNKTWISEDQYKAPKVFLEQKYLGEKDYEMHFNHVLKAFKDSRYICIDRKPIFSVFDPLDNRDIKNFISTWKKLAFKNGLEGIYFIGHSKKNKDCNEIIELGFDAVCREGIRDTIDKINGRYINSLIGIIRNKFKLIPLNKYKYSILAKNLIVPEIDSVDNIIPTVLPNYDHSPRSGRKALIFHNSTPELFRILLKRAISVVKSKDPEHKVIFLRSWNEWAEGNYIEPDLKFGHDYLNILKEEIFEV